MQPGFRGWRLAKGRLCSCNKPAFVELGFVAVSCRCVRVLLQLQGRDVADACIPVTKPQMTTMMLIENQQNLARLCVLEKCGAWKSLPPRGSSWLIFGQGGARCLVCTCGFFFFWQWQELRQGPEAFNVISFSLLVQPRLFGRQAQESDLFFFFLSAKQGH